jgi:hypothetical protein
MRGRLVNDAIAARFAGPAPSRRYFAQDIMAIGQDGKRSEHDPEKWVPVSRLREALRGVRRAA